MTTENEVAQVEQKEQQFDFKYGRPFGSRVVVQVDTAAEVTAGGIVIPDTAKERPQFGTILAIGAQVVEALEPGDRIIFSKAAGVPIIIGDNTFYVMQEREIFMKVDQEEVDRATLEAASKKAREAVENVQETLDKLQFKSDKPHYAVHETISLSWNCNSLEGSAILEVYHGKKLIEQDKVSCKRGIFEYYLPVVGNYIPELTIKLNLVETYNDGKQVLTKNGELKIEVHQ